MATSEEPNLLSPEGGNDGNSTGTPLLPAPTNLFPREMELAERFIRIVKYSNLSLEDAVPDSSLTPIKELFQSFGIENWPDLAFFSHDDVNDHFKNFPSTEITLRDVKAMGYLFRFAKVNTNEPPPRTTMRDVIASVDMAENLSKGATPPVPVTPTQDRLRKTVPELDKFKGTDEDSFGWMEDTLTKLGAAGLARYLTEPSLAKKKPILLKVSFTHYLQQCLGLQSK